MLDENFSLELPRVLGSHLALASVRQNFPGAVHNLKDTDISALDLNDGNNHLVIVHLEPLLTANNEKTAISENGISRIILLYI